MIEVTTSTKLSEAKLVMDQLLVDMTDIWPSLSVVQARVLSQDGDLKVRKITSIVILQADLYLQVTYPSKTDLVAVPEKKIRIIRQ